MTWQVIHADCLDAMRDLEEASVDAVVTDPPYGLEFMGKEWDRLGRWDARDKAEKSASMNRDNAPIGTSPTYVGGLAAQTWHAAWAAEALRVLKPGGHLLSFGGTRTYHRLACALEDAGFEIRDCLAWLYGSGFPKSLDVSKAIDKAAGAAREVVGVDPARAARLVNQRDGYKDGTWETGPRTIETTAPVTPDAERWQGWGTALKPAFEPIVLARKPLSGTVAENVLQHGTGALNVDGTRIGTSKDVPASPASEETWERMREKGWVTRSGRWDSPGRDPNVGRWPANVLLDEAWEPVLCLRYSLSDDAWDLLSEWCDARSDVPTVRGRDRRSAEPGEAPEVLFAQVPRPVDVGEPARIGSPDERSEALAGVAREDAPEQASNGQARVGEPQLEGLVSESGLRDGQSTGRAGDPRASAGDGAGARTATRTRRGSPSSQRGQVGQSAGEPEPVDGGRSRSGAPAGLRRAPTAPCTRREVLLRDVPEAWLTYFDFTGDVARTGAAALLDEQSGEAGGGFGRRGSQANAGAEQGMFGIRATGQEVGYGDAGGASRFFYTAKTSRAEREVGKDYGAERNGHPTVKPVDLMQWLCRLITPPGGLVLDPFLGSGSTGIAALREGFSFIGIEREADYVEIARARIIGDAPLLNVGAEI